jgi:type IV pilus assembly protein PilE
MINTRKKGFTLIELMTVVAIVAVLAALAIPSFLESLRKSRRSDAMNTIMDIHLAQQKYRANNTTYGTNVQLGFANPQMSPDGHYSVAVTLPLSVAARATTYAITATAQAPQDKDYCGNFTLTNTAGVITKTTSAGVADQCWRK